MARVEPRPPDGWEPEPELPDVDELLGPWYWGNTPFHLIVSGGVLRLQGGHPGRTSRFVHTGNDCWRGLDAYFTGETLRVVRDPSGGIDRLDLASYELRRRPYA